MKKHRALKITGIVLGSLILLIAAAVGITCLRLSSAVENVTRMDDDGYFYSMDYAASYDNALMKLPITFIKKFGCSAFISHNEEGDVITARNYDLPHTDDDGTETGLNVVFTLRPEGKYASINFADAAWLTMVGIPYTAGAFDEGASPMFLAFLPYLCMDGMNEKGLTVSILALDVKDGEEAVDQTEDGKDTVTITEMLRLMLDNCADVEEAMAMAQAYNLTNIIGSDFHLFVTDAAGESVVMEWRYNTLTFTSQDAVTNFYVGYDDAEDCYYGDALKEAFVRAEGLTRDYHYGYGHGYARFSTVAEVLDDHITDPGTGETMMTDAEAMDTLAAVSQEFDGTDLTSLTQYSVIYNSTDLTADVCVMRDYTVHYTFSLED